MKLKGSQNIINDFANSLHEIVMDIMDGTVTDAEVEECSRYIFNTVHETAIEEVCSYFAATAEKS